ncbi:MAG: ABC transporter ATP-binding protein, partial [Spirochaetaceae bacterium]|nr:ABC transporter ATP-binding protein [Spirochaetaceae bacterium]
TTALVDISLDVASGSIFAVVGPDGAGKSTLLRLMCGLLSPDSGEIEVLGRNADGSKVSMRRRLGYMSQRFSLYGDLSIDENLAFSAEIYGMDDYRDRREDLLEMTGLTPFRNRLADRLSGGMRQKLALAGTLIHNPELILMDEAARADNVAFLHQGRLMLSGSPGDIRREWGKNIAEFFCQNNRGAYRFLRDRYPESDVQIFGGRVHLIMDEKNPDIAEPATLLEADGIRVTAYGSVWPRLENVFLSMLQESTE